MSDEKTQEDKIRDFYREENQLSHADADVTALLHAAKRLDILLDLQADLDELFFEKAENKNLDNKNKSLAERYQAFINYRAFEIIDEIIRESENIKDRMKGPVSLASDIADKMTKTRTVPHSTMKDIE